VSRVALNRIVLSLAGVAAGGVLMAAVLSLVNGSEGFAFCTATGRFGWLVPLVAGLVIGAVSLSLLADPDVDQATLRADSRSGLSCSSCGGTVIEGSRLCPSCGCMIDRDCAVVRDGPLSEAL